MLVRQLEAIFDELLPAAAKTGMLYSSALIQVTADFFQRHPIPLVVDPVMISNSGTRLLRGTALSRLKDEIFPLATVLTPNLSEAELLAGGRIRSVPDLREAARKIQSEFGCAVVVKGGHLRGAREAVDVFRDRTEELILRAPFVRGVRTHGTGCTFSAAIAGYLALGRSLRQAVTLAKQHITTAIRHSRRIGTHSVLGFRRGG